MTRVKLLFFVTEDWYFCSHRLPIAIAASDAGYDVCVVTRVRKHGDYIQKAGIRLIEFENSRGGSNPVRELSMLIRLILLYRRERPDIVHHVAMKPVLYGSIAASIANVPHVVNALAGMGWLFTSASGFVSCIKPLVRWFLEHLLCYGIVLVQNPDDARLVREMGIPEEKIRLILGSGVDIEYFKCLPEKDSVPVVVLPARLLWDKGVGEFVSAARLLKQQGIAARFCLAGDPDHVNPSAVSSEQIMQWVQEGVVEHLGWITDMQSLFSQSHIVCLPSYREGLPKALIEAAAAGRPIVTTNVPGCREVVRDGYNGLLVPVRDSTALASALARLILNPSLRLEMGANGRVRAEKEFALTYVVQQTLSVYAETMD